MVERLIYSLWTKPLDGEHVGFNSENSMMECFALSLHYSKKWFKEVHLVTDFKGKELVEKWGLEFDYINIDLESELNGVDKSNWSLGKIYACKIQNKPFIHIDMDVILFKPLPNIFLEKDASFQNLEKHSYHTFYGNMINFDKNNYKNPPLWYKFPTNDNGQSFNCGVMVFNRLDILNEWWEESLKYVNYLSSVGGYGKDAWNLPSVVFEQHFISSICNYYNLNVGFLTDFHDNNKSHMDFIDDELSEKLGYTHLISESKRNYDIENKVRNRLEKEKIKLKILI